MSFHSGSHRVELDRTCQLARRITRGQSPGLAPVNIGAGVTSIVGHDNLIEHSLVPVPPDTLTADPRLGPLAWNGGPTRTHMPASDSPVLEHGSNLLGCKYDQRRPGFPRVKGACPDIGAVER